MPNLLTLSRAARLIGVRRGALQLKIQNGELATFEGMVSADDLQRAYPQAHLENNSGLERLDKIKDAAYAKRMRERLMPSAEALEARLVAMSREREQVETRLEHYRTVVEGVKTKLAQMCEPASSPLAVLDRFSTRLTAATAAPMRSRRHTTPSSGT